MSHHLTSALTVAVSLWCFYVSNNIYAAPIAAPQSFSGKEKLQILNPNVPIGTGQILTLSEADAKLVSPELKSYAKILASTERKKLESAIDKWKRAPSAAEQNAALREILVQCANCSVKPLNKRSVNHSTVAEGGKSSSAGGIASASASTSGGSGGNGSTSSTAPGGEIVKEILLIYGCLTGFRYSEEKKKCIRY